MATVLAAAPRICDIIAPCLATGPYVNQVNDEPMLDSEAETLHRDHAGVSHLGGTIPPSHLMRQSWPSL